ncbi:UPF0158 family protein [Methylotuvimicrobium buryatense]|uniref:Uncharacterized protein n=1 Tax=Methylotuvimicrobium buryatense TaxID=95641 RepID=A0A4P9UM18_METBY|nr:UPF0158 family protein [Methylotuvimicrobium buryatense]QCW82322.1 hypothetical protein EQU24_08765 [Methylotuvimicrobium buryatense]
MTVKIVEIIEAIEFISADPSLDSEAFLSRETGKIHIRPGDFDFDDAEDLPEDLDDPDRYIGLPHKHDLDLGNSLVRSFVAEFCPAESEKVRDMFRKRGAYSRFKNWAESKNLLDDWYRFENESAEAAIREWCEDNDIKLMG